MSSEVGEDAFVPWQVRAWRRPAVRRAVALVALAACVAPLAWAWSGRAAREEARAERAEAAAELERVFTDDQAGMFMPLEAPEPGDWRAEHEEHPQSLIEYMSVSPNVPTPERPAIYLRAVGPWPEDSTELEALREFAQAYFQVPVKLGAPLEAPGVQERVNAYTDRRQWRSDQLLYVLARDLPDDAFCVLGVTHVDLWPGEGWNFVFGQASLRERVGIFSFARHDDAFFGGSPSPLAKRRARDVKVMTHEIGHMFTIEHCQAYRCNMNGSNSLRESDSQPLHLCPVCAQKLHHAVGFDPITRYTQLEEVYRRHGLTDQADWMVRRLTHLRGQGR